MSDPKGESIFRRVTPAAAKQLRAAIDDAGGNEVFFAGALDASGRVCAVRVCARGNEAAVPALFGSLAVRDVVIHNHPGGGLKPSGADLSLAAIYSAHGHGVFIVDNEATRVYVVVEPFLPDDTDRLDTADLAHAFAPGSALARHLPAYETRPQQVEMMGSIARAFNEDGISVVEAPTGVGKTVAYLLPAALWAVQNKERVVVSTRTINLQEQIVFKDVPLLQRCLKKTFRACLVKGRSNYLCRRRLERAISEATLFEDEEQARQLNALTEWAAHTEDGSLSDLPFVPARDLWEQVCSEPDTCAMSRCPQQKECFVAKARREIAKADIIVTNHHMLFSDIAIKKETGDFTALAVLPAFRRVIFDEAHNIEDSATEYFGASVTRLGALATLGRLARMEHGRERGLLPFIKLKLLRDCHNVTAGEFEAMQALIDRHIIPSLEETRQALMAAFAAVRSLVAERCEASGRELKLRLTEQVLLDPELRSLHDVYVTQAVRLVRQLVGHCHKLRERMEEVEPNPNEHESPLATEILQLRAYANRAERMGNVLAEGTSRDLQENTVRWVEVDSKNTNILRIARCPLEVGLPLSEWVYENLKTVAMTSATLTVDRSFDYLFRRLGVDLTDRERVDSLMLDSPFDFEEQALLCIADDLPDPNERAFLDASEEAIRAVLRITRGHAFILFTSFYALDRAYRAMKDELADLGITALKQGHANRTQLLDQFRSDASSVLFGTDSFWEGVDVAGDSLQCVILPKLPFRVPTEPILQARAEAISQAGGNPFMDYAVPQAVIKFRQGFGRLIRRRTDRGAIVVLDRRIVTKYYGRVFLQSLPNVHLVRGPQQGVLLALNNFFDGNRQERLKNGG